MQPQEISTQNRLQPSLIAHPPRFITDPTSSRLPPLHPFSKVGQVFVFGSAVGGELGLGSDSFQRRKPGLVKRLPSVVALESGGQHTLALSADGVVYSWGVNDQGALGRVTADVPDDYDDDEDGEVLGTEAFLPIPVDIPERVIQMVCADSFSAVLTVSGDVYAWGSFRDPSGVIGFCRDSGRESQRLPRKVSFGNERIVLLGSGENHVFAVSSGDNIWAFGANDEAQLGRRASSRFKNNLEPYEIRGTSKRSSLLHHIVKITGGAYHTLYINNSGELYSFGCNNCGQLGHGDVDSHISGPQRIEYYIDADGKTRRELPPIVDIAAGESHSLAVTADGRVLGWGANLEGQLGFHADRPIYGDERDFEVAQPAEKRRKKAAAGDSSATSSAQSSPGRADFKLKFQPYPRVLSDSGEFSPTAGDPIVAVHAQARFSLCVSSLGNLFTWGSGHCFQLGNEEVDDEATPYKVELKGRKCFWARCGGQFTMFLLEPKQSASTAETSASKDVEMKQESTTGYRTQPTIMPSSMPGSPIPSSSQSSPRKSLTSGKIKTPPAQKSPLKNTSPTRDIMQKLDETMVSPDGKKKLRGAKNLPRDGPWSPTKTKRTAPMEEDEPVKKPSRNLNKLLRAANPNSKK